MTHADPKVHHPAGRCPGESSRALRGNVRVTAPDAFGAYFVAPALAGLHRRHPDLTVELLTATREPNLHQSGFDAAITVGTPTSGQVVSEPLSDYFLGLYATDGYLREEGVPGSVEDLHRHTLVWYVDSLLHVGELDLDKHLPGITPRVMSTSVFAQVESVRCGGGIGLLPCFVADRHPELRRILREQVAVRLGFTLSARRERSVQPAVQAIRAAIQAQVRGRVDELLPDQS